MDEDLTPGGKVSKLIQQDKVFPLFIREGNGMRKNKVKKAKQLSHLLGNLFIHAQNGNF